jgi:hypothetical protein
VLVRHALGPTIVGRRTWVSCRDSVWVHNDGVAVILKWVAVKPPLCDTLSP